ncbi:MAG: OmpA family protein [Saonia sp.]
MILETVGKHIVSFCFLFLGTSIMAQNLVLDPSFEVHDACPRHLSNFDHDLPHWSTPTRGTTDYFNSCSEHMGVPNNFNGFQRAKSGNGYAGLYVYAPEDYREYIQAEFTETLVKGKKYKASFYMSLAEGSDYALRDLGIVFSEEKLNLATDKNISRTKLAKVRDHTHYMVEVKNTDFYSNSKKWMLVAIELEAKGNENFMVIGNFNSNARTIRTKPKNMGPKPKRRQKGEVSYYYVDMLEMVSLETVAVSEQPKPYELNKTHIFHNVLFEFDDFRLLETAMSDLRNIYNYLQDNSTLSITINGHTDSVGPKHYNQVLSNKRAWAVADYLQKLGLAKDRIVWQGYGGKKPLATNTTEEGRQQNRRVEFVITEKAK